MRKEKLRRKNVATILGYMFKRTALSYTLLFHAEDIAEETLSDTIHVNGVPIYSVDNNKPQYVKNRRVILRYLKRRSEIKPLKIVSRKDSGWKLV